MQKWRCWEKAKHALLSASSAHRWMNCPPSARLTAEYTDTGSDFARQGTDAHSLCEHKLKELLGMETTDPMESLSYYDEEIYHSILQSQN